MKDNGAEAAIKTPNRHIEGYGLNKVAVEQIAAEGSALIITVDCGITNIAETESAHSLGMDVIITDHHECGDTLPDTPYIINAKRKDSTYPDDRLAGCGVVFKLIHALSSLPVAMGYIDLIAIGTITDIVPLLGENRVIAHMGLEKLRKKPSAGVSALAEAAGISLSGMTSYGVSFSLGPRINAAGRMDTAHLAIDILKAVKSSAALCQNARELCALNDRRRQEVGEIMADAEHMIGEQDIYSEPVIMLACPEWNTGVIGIAAAKIAEKYARPCLLLGGQERLIGSARSIEGVNIYEALAAFADRYEKFGGHAQAAGLTIAPEILEDLRRDLCEYLRTHYDESAFVGRRVYDMALKTADVSQALVDDINRLEPFGQGNEKPAIAIKNAVLKVPRFVGREDSPHLKFTMAQGDDICGALAFYYKQAHELVPDRADFICEANMDSFSGKPQLIVKDIVFRHSQGLEESFAAANAPFLLQGFFDELAQPPAAKMHMMTAETFCSELKKELAKSRFGLCVSVNTRPAFDYLVSLPLVQEALKDGRLALWDKKTYTPENCIACGQAAGHGRVMHVGMPLEYDALWNEEIKDCYRSYAILCFVSRDELLAYHKKLLQLLARRPRTADELARKLGPDKAKAVFALRVFGDLELLATEKNGRITALKTGQKKELRQSACYRGFEDLING